MSNTHIKIVGNNSIKDSKVMADEIGITPQQLMELQKGEFFVKVDSKTPVKVMAIDRFIGDNDALPEMQWKQHQKHWRKEYYTKIIDSTIIESTDDHRVYHSTSSLPTPKFDIEE